MTIRIMLYVDASENFRISNIILLSWFLVHALHLFIIQWFINRFETQRNKIIIQIFDVNVVNIQ